MLFANLTVFLGVVVEIGEDMYSLFFLRKIIFFIIKIKYILYNLFIDGGVLLNRDHRLFSTGRQHGA